MYLSRQLWSHSLLFMYLLVTLHQSIPHVHQNSAEINCAVVVHEHGDSKIISHEHKYQIGLFHFLSHLFEEVAHIHGSEHEHYLVKSSTKKFVKKNKLIALSPITSNAGLTAQELYTIPSSQYYSFFSDNKVYQSTIPRAPPV